MEQNIQTSILKKSKFRKLLLLAFGTLVILAGLTNVLAIGCKEFEDKIWLSNCPTSGSLSDCGTYYSKWDVKNNCPGKQDCFIKEIEINARKYYFNTKGYPISYVQISDTKESNCEDPSKAIYSKYALYQTDAKYEEPELILDCGEAKKNNLCSLTLEDWYISNCYSVKIHGDPNLLLDVIGIKYTWCWTTSKEENLETTQKIIKKDNVGNNDKNSFWIYLIFIVGVIVIYTFLKLRRKIKLIKRFKHDKKRAY